MPIAGEGGGEGGVCVSPVLIASFVCPVARVLTGDGEGVVWVVSSAGTEGGGAGFEGGAAG